MDGQKESVIDTSDIYEYHFKQLFNFVMRDRSHFIRYGTIEDYCDDMLIQFGTEDYYMHNKIINYAESHAPLLICRILQNLLKRYGVQYEQPPARVAPDKFSPFDFVINERGEHVGIAIWNDVSVGLVKLRERYRKYKTIARIEVYCLKEDRTSPKKGKRSSFADSLRLSNEIEEQEDGEYIHFAIIREFFEKYLSKEEYLRFRWQVNRFNLKVRTAIGYRTIVTPTEDSVERFKEKCAQRIKAINLYDILPLGFPPEQAEIMKKALFDRGLYRAMISNSDFADSYISSEWYYEIFSITGTIDRTGVVAGYLKSVEQLLFTILKLHLSEGRTIKELGGQNLVDFSPENEDEHDKALGSLIGFANHYDDIWSITPEAKKLIIDELHAWKDNYRNGYFHKDNLHNDEVVADIRKKAQQLNCILLGSFIIRDHEMPKIGICDPDTFSQESTDELFDRFEEWASPIIQFDVPDNAAAIAFMLLPGEGDEWTLRIQALYKFEATDYTWNYHQCSLAYFLYDDFRWKDNRSWKEQEKLVIEMVEMARGKSSPMAKILNSVAYVVIGSDKVIKVYNNQNSLNG